MAKLEEGQEGRVGLKQERTGKVLQLSGVSDSFDRPGQAVCEKSLVLSLPSTGVRAELLLTPLTCFANCGFRAVFQVVVSEAFYFSVLRELRKEVASLKQEQDVLFKKKNIGPVWVGQLL